MEKEITHLKNNFKQHQNFTDDLDNRMVTLEASFGLIKEQLNKIESNVKEVTGKLQELTMHFNVYIGATAMKNKIIINAAWVIFSVLSLLIGMGLHHYFIESK
jgi:hypothetical protein